MAEERAAATGRPLILCYHAVSDSFDNALAVRTRSLHEQMSILVDQGYRFDTFTAVEHRRRNGDDVSKLASVTFDDGYESTLLAAEVLDEFGIPGTVFVLPPSIGADQPMSWPGIERLASGNSAHELRAMSLEQMRQLVESGWEVGSHTMHHRRLTRIDDHELMRELADSRERILHQIGTCHSVAYPYGRANPRVARAAERAGYESGTTLAPWHRRDTPMTRPRIGVYLHDDRYRFKLKIARWTRALRRLPSLLP